jgi:hypothetical protein
MTLSMGCVEFMPDFLVAEISVESFEKCVVHLDLSSFQALPCSVRIRAADGKIDPVRWNAIFLLVL